MNRIDITGRRTRRTRWVAGIAMAALAVIAAIISYNDGLFLIRYAGAAGWVAVLYPLLPDGLIVISSSSLYEAAITKAPRPRWAVFGLVLGCGLTLVMNVAAGLAVSVLLAVADGFVPVVFFTALEILIGLVRRAQVAPKPVPASVPIPAREGVREIRARHRVSQATAVKMRNYAAERVRATQNGHGDG